ncbi:MAG: tetratricopeptide repeat protein, partial [Caldilineaceae bacterium]|nr:tetratricopeptide repeat protein [Caldilineaceae bacterium]
MEKTAPNPTTEPAFLTIPQAAARMGRSGDFVRRLCREGQLPGAVQEYERGPWRIPAEAVEAWLQAYPPSKTLKQRVRSAPLWQKVTAVLALVVAVVTPLNLLLGFFSNTLATVQNVRRITATETPTPTATPTLTATPLAVATESSGETLILIPAFHVTAGNADFWIHREIRDRIRSVASETGERTVRVEVEPTVLTSDQQMEAETLGKHYNASMVMWGDDTGARVTVNFRYLRELELEASKVTVTEARSQTADPVSYHQFVTDDLPRQMTFLALFAIGQSYYLNADYTMAIQRIEAAVASVSSTAQPGGLADAYFRLGWLYHESTPTNLDKAVANYTEAIKLDPGYLFAFYNRGNAYFDQGDLDAAIEDYTEAIHLDPSYLFAFYNRGNARFNQGDLGAAIDDYTAVINGVIDGHTGDIPVDSIHIAAFFNRGNAHFNQGDLDAAIEDYTEVTQLDPTYLFAFYNRGNAHFNQGDLGAAIEDYSEAIELAPDYTFAYNNRGNAHKAQGDFTKAIIDFDNAIQRDADFALAYSNRGDAHRIQGNLAEAITDFRRYLELE